jgi:hypothetical protein
MLLGRLILSPPRTSFAPWPAAFFKTRPTPMTHQIFYRIGKHNALRRFGRGKSFNFQRSLAYSFQNALGRHTNSKSYKREKKAGC